MANVPTHSANGAPYFPGDPRPPQDRDASARNIFVEMCRVAERDLAGDALKARIADIHAHAKAAGWQLAEPDPRTAEQQYYDRFNTGAAWTAEPPAPSGYPSALPPRQIELWQKAGDADPARMFGDDLPEAITRIDSWLRSAAAAAQATELLGLAKKNALVMRSLLTYANANQRYRDFRPQ